MHFTNELKQLYRQQVTEQCLDFQTSSETSFRRSVTQSKHTVCLCTSVTVCVCVYVGLKFLVRLCTDMNLKEAQDYANKLKKAEKMQKLREEVQHFSQ